VFIESAFNLPGLGGLLRQSTLRRDVPMIAGSVLFLALAITVLNLLVDVAYAMLDPRLRAASRTPQRA
jgi:peptide/nickel transport system permease protein